MKKIMFVVNVDWFFISHRLPIALSAIERGYDVYLLCNDTGKFSYLESLGIKVFNVNLTRSGVNFFSELKVFLSLFFAVKKIKPDIIHGITIKPVFYCSIIAKLLSVNKRVFSISGLGYLFIDQKKISKMIRKFIFCIYKFTLNNKKSIVIFQNTADRDLFINANVITLPYTRLIKGSGVDLDKFTYTSFNDDTCYIVFIARLLKDKGVIEFCDAAKFIKSNGSNAEFLLVGDLDFGNPNSMCQKELNYYTNNGFVTHLGFVDNVFDVLSLSNVVVLPSYREGLPKSLIEASAVGRAIITTDVPGCRDAIIHNDTGICVPPKNVPKLSSAIEYLINNPNIALEMGVRGRNFAEENFSIDKVVSAHIAIYENL